MIVIKPIFLLIGLQSHIRGLNVTNFSNGQKFFLIMAVFVCSLLFYANAVTFNLISAPSYVSDIIAYSALSVAVALTLIMITIVIRDKSRGVFSKTQKPNVIGVIKESNALPIMVPSTVDAQENPDKVESNPPNFQTIKESEVSPTPVPPSAESSNKRLLFAISIAAAASLLIFANLVTFGLIPLPEYFAFAAASGAVALATAMLVRGLIDKISGATSKNPDSQFIVAVKESNEASCTIQTGKIPDKTPIAFNAQKIIVRKDEDTAEEEKPPTKKATIPLTKLICPACRKEFSLPIYEKDLIVDFGPPKKSNIIKPCPNCGVSIPLKRKVVVEEEDLWKF